MVSCKTSLRLGKTFVAVQAGVVTLCKVRPITVLSILLYSDSDDNGAPK